MTTLSYLNLITSEFRDQPKYIAMLTSIFDQFVSVSNVLDYINKGLDVDSAQGAQLDIIGQYLGQSRKLSYNITGLTGALNDDDYRFLLKAKIAQLAWDGTNGGIIKLWNELFPGVEFTLVDNQDMTCDIIISSLSLSSIMIGLIEAGLIIPRPAGVKYEYSFVSETLFAYDVDTEYFSGYDIGHWNGTVSN